jgi:hypothetical protein
MEAGAKTGKKYLGNLTIPLATGPAARKLSAAT